MIRPALMGDVKPIHALLQQFASRGLLLGRALSTLYDQLRDFIVYEERGTILGVCSLHICWENLAEIRSLAVREEYQRRGIGRQMVESCLDDAKSLDINQIFALTYQQGFFRRLGFVPIDKQALPQKIWGDCLHCPKFPDCDEEALIWREGQQTAG
ncbi:MAG: GNAT family N-acetyltransferase [Desulfobulbaceae bacterium A2]|nr:MAG: GNAT family N-acetyltransferase [Desulfobulbaceae bacterium A2]